MLTIVCYPEAVIGFLETNYSASELSEHATLVFGLISGGVQSNVNVQLGFSEGTALGKQSEVRNFSIQHYIVYIAGVDFNSTGGVFTFNSSSAITYTFDVPLVSDDVYYEFIENFTAQLSFVEAAE